VNRKGGVYDTVAYSCNHFRTPPFEPILPFVTQMTIMTVFLIAGDLPSLTVIPNFYFRTFWAKQAVFALGRVHVR
jgi:hypothetical protein